MTKHWAWLLLCIQLQIVCIYMQDNDIQMWIKVIFKDWEGFLNFNAIMK